MRNNCTAHQHCIAQGVMPLIGYIYGAKDYKRVRDVTKLAFTVLWIFAILFLLLVQLIQDAFIRMFIDEPQTVSVWFSHFFASGLMRFLVRTH